MKPHVYYFMPAAVRLRTCGVDEMTRRRAILERWAGGNAFIDIGDLDDGACTIECFADEARSAGPAAARVREIVGSGVDAIIIGCYADTILDAARELSPVPVIGPAQTSMHYAAMLGERFSILTAVPSVVPMIRRLVRVYGMESRLASILPVDVSILEMSGDNRRSHQLLLEKGRKAIDEDGADSLILGCMSMSFDSTLNEPLQDELGVPILNPARIALDVAISLCGQNLRHGRSGFTAIRGEEMITIKA